MPRTDKPDSPGESHSPGQHHPGQSQPGAGAEAPGRARVSERSGEALVDAVRAAQKEMESSAVWGNEKYNEGMAAACLILKRHTEEHLPREAPASEPSTTPAA